MKKKYEHLRIEAKWQKFWEENHTFQSDIEHTKPKYYVLDMFPYPSGSGLHVGHVTGYTGTDILARYKRQKGYNVLHPMGWDSFGLQAEQYAVRTGQHPAITTKKNIKTFKRQLKSLGLSYDWSREFATSDPKYYKWTQWIFTKLYEKNLAYEAEVLVNYCPHLGTVLANEEVEEGKAKEGGYPVIRKPLRQWVLKITDYAERLLDDLDLIDWPEYLKTLQRNWIGKSEGANIHFPIDSSDEKITVYTTRHDTLFGVTYLVLAPEHPLVSKITTLAQKNEVEEYIRKAASKSDLERTELIKEKTGAFTGSYAINPVNDAKVPIWIADYVLANYGTGAVMAVPGGDERDFAFTQAYHLPVIPVYDPEDFVGCEDLIPEGVSKKQYRKEILEGKHYWNTAGKCINSASKSLDLNGETIEKAKEKVANWLQQTGHGERAVSYKLRDWLFSRQRYWGEPFPILHFEDGTKRILGLDELPLCPPELDDYKPSGDGQSPLAKVRDWVEIQDPKTGKKAYRETNTMPQWAGSCWYYLRFCDPHNETEAWSQESQKYWLPVDMYVGGVEHAVLHLLYARFWHKVLFDCGYVETKEPFQTLRNQGLVTSTAYLIPQGGYEDPLHVTKKGDTYISAQSGKELIPQVEKMSKSKLNGVSPDEIIQEYGADSLRLYEMFMGPFDKEKFWNTDAVSGCYRFLRRIFDLVHSDQVTEEESFEGMRLAHQLVHGVEQDLEKMLFNTAIAKMMEFVNAFSKLPTYPKKALKMLIQVLSPFAPHLAEECWEKLTQTKAGISYVPFPKVDPQYLQEDIVTYVVQVNGKVRGKWDMKKNQSKEELLAFVRSQPKIQPYLQGQIVKTVFVPNRLVNFVVK